MEPNFTTEDDQSDKSRAIYRFDVLDMPMPFTGEIIQRPESDVGQDLVAENIGVAPVNSVEQTVIPTPPPELAADSPDSSHSVSPLLSASAKSDSYIKGSSLEESPVSSPNSSCSGDVSKYVIAQEEKHVIKQEEEEEFQITNVKIEDDKSMSDQETEGYVSHEQNVPKNIKLPQRKGGMQLWQFLYALLNDPEKKYSKLIEWTANNLSREFRLLEPEAIAIWWGEHKNKKNMSYDKLSRSLRYYYDKGIIRKISGERYVYQFCIDPEVMYKHIGNSDSRPKLKPMPQSAFHATSEYQSQHGFTSTCGLVNRDSCYIAQGPMSLGMMHNHLLPPRPSFHTPQPSYHAGMPSFLTHGFSDSSVELHHPHSHLGVYNTAAFFPSGSYDSMTGIPSMTASLGYPQIEHPPSLKAHLPSLRKYRSFEVPALTPSHLKYESESSYGQSPLLNSVNSSHNVILSSQTLSPPPLTSNRAPSPISPQFTAEPNPLPPSYSNHSSPHAYSTVTTDDPLGFDELMTAEEYSSSNSLTYQLVGYSTCNTTQSVTCTVAGNTWDEL